MALQLTERVRKVKKSWGVAEINAGRRSVEEWRERLRDLGDVRDCSERKLMKVLREVGFAIISPKTKAEHVRVFRKVKLMIQSEIARRTKWGTFEPISDVQKEKN